MAQVRCCILWLHLRLLQGLRLSSEQCCSSDLTHCRQVYMQMWSFMTDPENKDDVMVKSNAEVRFILRSNSLV